VVALCLQTYLLILVWGNILRDMDRPSSIALDAPTWQRYTLRSLGLIFHGSIVVLLLVPWWRALMKSQIPRRVNRLLARLRIDTRAAPPENWRP